MSALRPTITHRVRAFLHGQGADLRPWSGLDQTYGELYALLAKRRDDRSFWEPLSELLGDVLRDAADTTAPGRLPAPGAELLGSGDVDELIRSLREALPGGDQPRDPSTVSRFAAGLSSAAMAGFLVLGLAAAGCADANDPNASWDGQCGSAVLQQTLEQSDMTETRQAELCDCFAQLNQQWVDGLESLFEQGSPEEISAALLEIAECWDIDRGALSGDYDDARAHLVEGGLCFEDPQPAYKGVSFLNR